MAKDLEEIIKKHHRMNKIPVRNLMLLSLFIIFIIGVLLVIRPQTIGFVILETAGTETTVTWDFSDSGDYNYDDSLIDLSNNEAKLKTTTDLYSFTHSDFGNGTLSNINLVDGGISPKKNVNVYHITQAIYDSHDKTSKVDTIGNDHQNVNKNNIFDVFFGGELSNGDDISFYLKNSAQSEIYLCDPSIQCSSPGYGSVSYDGGEGWYNITISGLSSPQNSFNIDPPTNVKIDYIEATHYSNSDGSFISAIYDAGSDVEWGKISWEESLPLGTEIVLQTRTSSDNINWEDWSSDYDELGEQITSGSGRYIQFKAVLTGLLNVPVLNSITIDYSHTKYLDSGVIETEDVIANDLISWGLFTKTESLNNQNIDYYYSLDSGDNWVEVSDNDLSSVDISTGKIRFRALLTSDESSTPIIEEMQLTYEACQENWGVNYGDCMIDDTKLKYYTDANNCGTTNELPADNGTYVECDYCTPNWIETNTSCQIDDTITSYFTDENNCYDATGLDSDNQIPSNNIYSCDYCTPEWNCNEYGSCQSNDKIQCLNVTDNNSCYQQTGLNSDLYSGNYSEFEQSCVYDETAPFLADVVIDPQKASAGDLINITASVTDTSDISYVKAIVKDSEGRQIKEINLERTGDLFIAALNTTNMSKGTYVVDFDTEDSIGNRAYYRFKGIIALDYSAENAVTLKKDFYAEQKATINNLDIVLEIIPNRSISNVSVGLAKYSNNIKNLVPSGVKDIRKFIDILPDEDVKNSTEKVTIRIYYNDSEIQGLNINEGTLKIYHYNEETSGWDVLNSTVNMTGNYVEVTVNHFSTYAIFGEEVKEEVTESSSSGGSSSGAGSFGGGRVVITEKKRESETKKIEETKKEEKTGETKEVCEYSYIVNIPDEISFLENNIVEGQIKNNGSCVLDKVGIQLSPNILEYVVINNSVFDNIGKSETVQFQLTLKPEEVVSREKLLAQGFAVRALRNTIKSYKGEIITKGVVQSDVLQEEKVPVEVWLLRPADFKTFVQDKGFFLIANTISILIAVFVVIVLMRKGKRKLRTS